MDGKIPDELVDRIRSGNDIVEVVSEVVALKKTGANYLGLCPFHTEKTPSFTVSPGKQIFHCFGCGAGGDVVGFLMRHENYTFPEALRRLAEKAGIAIPETSRESRQDSGELDAVINANEEAAGFFARALWETPEGEKARTYLEGRGMSAETAREFGVGYSMPGWDSLLKHLERKGIGAAMAEKAGLAIPRSSGSGHYDRFRDRLMFTIRDARGRVIGFGGRTMSDEQPKYLNSPETRAFRKGETLYALDVAGQHIRKRGYSVITEGYFDAIACHVAGAQNAVATLGTALTSAHLRLLKRYSENVVLVFDSDAAGIKAAERSLDVFLGTAMNAKVALLPQGDDPDSLVKRDGPKGLADRLRATEKLLDFVIRRAAAGAGTIDEKVEAAARITGILARIENGVERSHYLKAAAGLLGIEESAIAEELGKKLGKDARTGVFRAAGRKPAASPMNKIEEELLHLALIYPEVACQVRDELTPEDFSDGRLRPIAAGLFGMMDEAGSVDVPKLLGSIEDEELKKALYGLSVKEREFDDPLETARGSVGRLLKGRVDRKLAELSGQMREAEIRNDLDRLNKLQKEFAEWQKRKSSTR
ncbi:MAG: DNA primase [Nitrospirae bacterium]|nr:DNA primase [Nitrospirota bacterium]